MPGSALTLTGVGLNPTRTGLLDALLAMGGEIHTANLGETCGEPVGDIHVRHSRLHGTEVAGELVVRMIDEFPAFAAAAAFAEGQTLVRDAQELRYKESDRISALCAELQAAGVSAEETPDGFILLAAVVRGGRIDPHGDHRLAMALAVAGLAADGPLQVAGAEIMRELFPDFAGVLTGLGAEVNVS